MGQPTKLVRPTKIYNFPVVLGLEDIKAVAKDGICFNLLAPFSDGTNNSILQPLLCITIKRLLRLLASEKELNLLDVQAELMDTKQTP